MALPVTLCFLYVALQNDARVQSSVPEKLHSNRPKIPPFPPFPCTRPHPSLTLPAPPPPVPRPPFLPPPIPVPVPPAPPSVPSPPPPSLLAPPPLNLLPLPFPAPPLLRIGSSGGGGGGSNFSWDEEVLEKALKDMLVERAVLAIKHFWSETGGGPMANICYQTDAPTNMIST